MTQDSYKNSHYSGTTLLTKKNISMTDKYHENSDRTVWKLNYAKYTIYYFHSKSNSTCSTR